MSWISDSLGITVMRTLMLMMKFPSESSQSLSSPEAEGRGLAQSQLVSAGLGVSWPRLSRGRARLTRVRTPASDGSRGRSVAIVALSSTVNSQQTIVSSPGDLVLTCYRQTPIVTAVNCVRCEETWRQLRVSSTWIVFFQWESMKQWLFWIKFRKLLAKINRRRYQQRQLCK